MTRVGAIFLCILSAWLWLPRPVLAYVLSLTSPPTVEGTFYTIRDQTPGKLRVTVTVGCSLGISEQPPTSLDFTYLLLTAGSNTVSSADFIISPTWTETRLFNEEATISFDFRLPQTGSSHSELGTGQYAIKVALADGKETRESTSSLFAYTVYSGDLYFGNIKVSLNSISPGPPCINSDIGLQAGTSLSWNPADSVINSDLTGICADKSANSDGYSEDLTVITGSAGPFAEITGTSGGINWGLVQTTLGPVGGSYLAAALTLPDGVTSHPFMKDQVWSRGTTSVGPLSGASFNTPIADMTISHTGDLYFHGYGLPFYVKSTGVSLALGQASSGLVLTSPEPYYAHHDQFLTLQTGHPLLNFGFPSNDAMFREKNSFGSNNALINEAGINGHLEFSGAASDMAFPRSRLTYPVFGVDIENNAVKTGSTLTGSSPVYLGLVFDPNCREQNCSNLAPKGSFILESPGAAFFSSGTLVGRFTNLGEMDDPVSSELLWGGYDGADGTFFRNDRDRAGVWVVPGYIMEDTAATTVTPESTRIGQILLGSFSFQLPPSPDLPIVPDAMHPLNATSDPAAYQGDGFYAGINMGPEILVGSDPAAPAPTAGSGAILDNRLSLRFSGNDSFTSMDDLASTKYVIRPGGITGVFNTAFGSSGQGSVTIYDYPLNFSRFSFSQYMNRIAAETFIDGELTLPPPVGDADGMRVGFTNLALTCNGNLGSGVLDTEPEPDWPNGDTPTGCDDQDSPADLDTLKDESCHVLSYWNVPILVTGMGFTDNGAGECSGAPRVLKLDTRNLVDRLGSTLTMSADYLPNGTFVNQQMFGAVDTWFDRPPEDKEEQKPGFSLRLQDAYLNQVDDPGNIPAWDGFTVLSGQVDVPLFDDAELTAHFENGGSLYLFAAGDDLDFDGIPAPFGLEGGQDGTGDVDEFRALLSPGSSDSSAKPQFSYSWPKKNIIDLTYHADYSSSAPDIMPQFIGIPNSSTTLAGILSIDSVADYINPLQTKFSFGVSADTEKLKDFSIDVGDLSSGASDFLASLGVSFDFDPNFNIDAMLLEMAQAEQLMQDVTGGDITDLLGAAIDQSLSRPEVAEPISLAVAALDHAHQAPNLLTATLTEPLETIRLELISFLSDSNLDLNALIPDIGDPDQVGQALAPFLKYSPDDLRSLYEASTGIIDPEVFNNLIDRFDRLQTSVNNLGSRLDQVKATEQDIVAFIGSGGTGIGGDIEYLIDLAETASDEVHNLYDSITVGLGNYMTASDSNELLLEIDGARDRIRAVKDKVATIPLGDIADALYVASLVAGAPMDMSMLRAAEETVNSSIAQLDQIIAEAEMNLEQLLNALPLSDILATVDDFIGDSGLVQQSLRGGMYSDPADGGVIGKLGEIQAMIPDLVASLGRDLNRVYSCLSVLQANQGQEVPVTWEAAITQVQEDLDSAVEQMWLEGQTAGDDITTSVLLDQLGQIYGETGLPLSFATVVADPGAFERILTAPLANLIRDRDFTSLMSGIDEAVTGILPHPSEEDVRALIRNAILNRSEVQQMNRIFFEQFGFLSDAVDDMTTQLFHQLNTMIRQAIAATDEALQQELDDAIGPIGPASWNVSSAGIDGYALVSQDEIERIHLEAEFAFGTDPDTSSYNAALDIATWRSSSERSGCIEDGGTGNIDVVISTHDVSANMLGMDVGLREALLGFTLQGSVPVGVFGRVYLLGELGFEAMALYDLGFESAFGSNEIYFAARGAGRFSDYQIPMAAFYVGRSCSGDVLARIDEKAGSFIFGDDAEITGLNLEGVYVRGAAEIPIYNNGCALTIGIGADMGAWYFSGDPGTYGGLLGGSAYGELGCLASAKGAMTLIGQKSGADYSFAGSGWAAAGVGYCSPGKWKSARDARKDDWCLTGEATYGATYIGDWKIDGPDVDCCH